MKYFNVIESIRAIICSSFLGFFMGGLYNSLSTLISCTRRLLFVWITVLRSHSVSDFKKSTVRNDGKASAVRKNVYDLIFFTVFGVLYIFLCYLLLDGVHRFYVLIPLIVVFIISKQTLGIIFEKIILFAYNLLYPVAFLMLYVLAFPLRKAYRLAYKLFERPIKYALNLLKGIVSAIRIQKKQKQIFKYFKSTPTIFSCFFIIRQVLCVIIE